MLQGLKEADEIEEDLDARVLGNFLHQVMELFYKGIAERKQTKVIDAADLQTSEQSIAKLIDEVFIGAYGLEPGKKLCTRDNAWWCTRLSNDLHSG
jgi:ATP-dependent helicase/DNAse subunit B